MRKPEDTNVELGLLSRQVAKVLNEIGTMRDDMSVMMAILQRLDGTVAGLVNEVRATHSQHNRLAARVRVLEEQAT